MRRRRLGAFGALIVVSAVAASIGTAPAATSPSVAGSVPGGRGRLCEESEEWEGMLAACCDRVVGWSCGRTIVLSCYRVIG